MTVYHSTQSISKLLSEGRIQTWHSLCDAVYHSLAHKSREILSFIFTPMPALENHPFEDSQEVFWQAVNQICPNFIEDQVLPLAFLGFHSINIFNGRRQAIGFLITSHSVVVCETRSLFGKNDLSELKKIPLDVGQLGASEAAASITAFATESFDWGMAKKLISDTIRLELSVLLTELVLTTIEARKRLALDIYIQESSSILAERLIELGLAKYVFLSGDPKKKTLLKRLRKTLGLRKEEELLFFVADELPFGFGVNGIGINKNMVASKGLFEDKVVLSVTAAERLSVICADDSIILNGHISLTIPDYIVQAGKARALALLMEDVLSGRVN